MLLPTSESIKLNYKQLHDLLLKLGYNAEQATGGQWVYHHARNKSLVTVKPARSNTKVPDVVIASVITNVLNTNVASERKLKKLISVAA